MKPTEIAAWWGAIVATLIFAWDIFKWKRSGAIISINASPNMKTFGGVPDGLENKTLIVVEATNIGNQKTTITHMVGFHYKNLFSKLTDKKDLSFFVPNPAPSSPLPYILGPGERWLGCMEQNQELEEKSRDGYLYCGIYHSCGKKPILQRVIVQEEKNT